MLYSYLSITLHIVILIPSIIYLVGYALTRKQRMGLLDVHLLGTPVICVLFTTRTLLYYASGEPWVDRDLTEFATIFGLVILSAIAAIAWSMLGSLWLAFHRRL